MISMAHVSIVDPDEEGKGPPSSVFRADHSSQSDAGDNPDMQEAVARQIKAVMEFVFMLFIRCLV